MSFVIATSPVAANAYIWDNNSTGGGNEHHGYFNHDDGSYLNNLESLVKTMIKAATSDDASYTLESIYNNAPK